MTLTQRQKKTTKVAYLPPPSGWAPPLLVHLELDPVAFLLYSSAQLPAALCAVSHSLISFHKKGNEGFPRRQALPGRRTGTKQDLVSDLFHRVWHQGRCSRLILLSPSSGHVVISGPWTRMLKTRDA